jgi:predicted AAA+ superfamily ATPase
MIYFVRNLDLIEPYFRIDIMERYLTKYIKQDLPSKIILLTGPRQTGKTTLSKMLKTEYDYLNLECIHWI